MRFILTKDTLSSSAELEITNSEFEEFVRTKQIVMDTLLLEEKFDIVVQNYVELEQTLMNSVLTYMLLGNHDFTSFNNRRGLIDRRIYNLLSSCRSYIDYAVQCAGAVPGCKNEVKSEFSRFYDQHFAYRLMEALRDFVTHGGLPTDLLNYRTRSVDNTAENRRLKYDLELKLTTRRLKQYGDFKRTVLDEINDRGGSVSLPPLIREYISDLGSVNEWLREKCEKPVDDAANKIQNAFTSFDLAFPADEKTTYLNAIELNGGKRVREVSIFLDLVEYIKHFHRKNRNLVNLHKRFVTSDYHSEDT